MAILIGSKTIQMTYRRTAKWIQQVNDAVTIAVDTFQWGHLHVNVTVRTHGEERTIECTVGNTPWHGVKLDTPQFAAMVNAVKLYRDNPDYAGMSIEEFVERMVGLP